MNSIREIRRNNSNTFNVIKDFVIAFLLSFVVLFLITFALLTCETHFFTKVDSEIGYLPLLIRVNLLLTLSSVLPMAFLSAIVIAFAREYSMRNNSSLKLRTHKIRNILLPIISIAMCIGLFIVILNGYILPKNRTFLNRTIWMPANIFSVFKGKQYIETREGHILYIDKVQENKLHGIHIWQVDKNLPQTKTLFAKEGEIILYSDKNMIKLKLINGTSDEPNLKSPGHFYKLNFKIHLILLPAIETFIAKRPNYMNLNEIFENIKEYQALHVDVDPLKAEVHQRVALAFDSLAVALLGVFIGIKLGEKKIKPIWRNIIGLAVGFFMIMGYYLLFGRLVALVEKGIIPQALGAWALNILCVGIGIIVMTRRVKIGLKN